MADLLRAGQEWLANQLKTHASNTVVYVRGANQVSVTAILGRTLMKLEDGYGGCLLYTSPSPRDGLLSRMPSSA